MKALISYSCVSLKRLVLVGQTTNVLLIPGIVLIIALDYFV